MEFWPELKLHYDKFHMHIVEDWIDCQTVQLFKEEVLIPLFWLDSYPNWLQILLQTFLLGLLISVDLAH